MLDAFDECESTQQDDILLLIDQLVKAGIRICFTTRPHVFQKVRSQMKDFVILPIAAHPADVLQYLKMKVAKIPLTEDLKKAVTKAISEEAGEMWTLSELY
jgi:hypothetical protein